MKRRLMWGIKDMVERENHKGKKVKEDLLVFTHHSRDVVTATKEAEYSNGRVCRVAVYS